MSLPLPLYRFQVGANGHVPVGKKRFLGEVTALCMVDAILAAEKKFAAVDKFYDVLDICVERQEPSGKWVPSDDYPETLADAWFYATGEEADSVPFA